MPVWLYNDVSFSGDCAEVSEDVRKSNPLRLGTIYSLQMSEDIASVTLYSEQDFGGESWTFNEDQEDLSASGFEQEYWSMSIEWN